MTNKSKSIPGFCESMVHYVESLARGRDHRGVVDYYEANREQVDSAGRDVAASILRQVARAHAALSDHQAALKTARIAQSLAAQDGDSLLLAEIFMTVAGILRDMGETKEAERAFRDAESIFRRQDCLEGQSRALNLLAGLFFRQNDFRTSLRLLLDATEIARKLEDRAKLAYMMGNIGRIYTFMGNFARAEHHLKMNVELSIELGDELETARAYLSLSYIYIQEADYTAAHEALDKAYPMIVNQRSRHDEAIYLTYLGELQYRSDQAEDGRETLHAALKLAEEIEPGSSLVGRAMRHLAELHVRAGNVRLAQKYAAGAMVIFKQAGDQVEMGALHKLQAQVAAANGKSEQARVDFLKSISMLDETGVRFEKVEAMVAAASCSVFERRQRMIYLFRAEEFYSRAKLTACQEKIGRMIGSLDVSATATLRGQDQGQPSSAGADYITASPEIKRIKKHLRALGSADLPVLLTGETGVGKDHMVRYFHSQVRPAGPYVAINCASVPETLLESELFGYRKGAFSGADHNKPGLFVKSDGGVLFLDEIGELPLRLQAKLLGVLERRSVLPLGSTTEIPLDFKLVAATNRDLKAMVEAGQFRRDLYYRLSGISFTIPPLRERKEDIPLLLHHFMVRDRLIGESETIPSELLRRFIGYDWPGNVRELDNKVKRLEVMTQLVVEGDLAELAHSLFSGAEMASIDDSNLFDRVEEFERRLILEALLAAHGNKSEAARLLGIHEATVRTKLKRYGLTYDDGIAPIETQQMS